jgi:hypothetical protein
MKFQLQNGLGKAEWLTGTWLSDYGLRALSRDHPDEFLADGQTLTVQREFGRVVAPPRRVTASVERSRGYRWRDRRRREISRRMVSERCRRPSSVTAKIETKIA